jgi:hypothetical protein
LVWFFSRAQLEFLKMGDLLCQNSDGLFTFGLLPPSANRHRQLTRLQSSNAYRNSFSA